jgi:hypothetical protein
VKKAFLINPADNVATLLADADVETIEVIGHGLLALREKIPLGHKAALAAIPAGGALIKFGTRIGHATRAIAAGDWVHLHNCASDYDERSNTLDNETGAPTDTTDAYA